MQVFANLLPAKIAALATHYHEQIERLDRAINADDPAQCLDCSKTLIETTYKTILTDLGITFSKNENLPGLFQKVVANIKINNFQYTEKIVDIFSLASSLIGSARNNDGASSHGHDGFYMHKVKNTEARLVARIAVALSYSLLEIHHISKKASRSKQLKFSDNPKFNDYLDSVSNNIEVAGVILSASEALFALDQTAYKEKLIEYIDINRHL